MRLSSFFESKIEDYSFISKKYPLAGPMVNGLEVIDKIDNTSSIKSSLNNYFVLKSVRVVSIDDFDLPDRFPLRIHELAEQIKDSKSIMPLIVVIDGEGPYILEGSHRIDALKLLGVKYFPALIVIDADEVINESIKIKNQSLNESTISLNDLYDEHELNDESEQLYHWVSPDMFDKQFQIKTMMPQQAKQLETALGDVTVFKAFNDHATKEQKRLVKFKANKYDFNRVVIIAGNTIVDGNHQVIASIISKNPLKYIDIDSDDSVNESIEFKEEQLPNGKDIIRFSDEIGGSGFLTINNNQATIIDWHAIPSDKRFSDDAESYKNRGFAVQVIKAIKNQLGLYYLKISMPSKDAQLSLTKMVDKGLLIPDESSKMGVSDSPYYTRFKIV